MPELKSVTVGAAGLQRLSRGVTGTGVIYPDVGRIFRTLPGRVQIGRYRKTALPSVHNRLPAMLLS